jgi:predicted membrane channel-forming protein YqfA (hemolysin III family)
MSRRMNIPHASAPHIPATVAMYHGERFNSITHAVGACLAAVGGVFLVR